MTYSIVEVFHTIQGEGFHAGTPAVFIRFAGCNLWTGRAKDRDRDAARNGALCPKWCDTDFVSRGKRDLESLMAEVEQLPRAPLCVLTGGEPLLQIDEALMNHLNAAFDTVAVETNGTQPCDTPVRDGLWITMSPKVTADKIVLKSVDELKVVYPDYDPASYDAVSAQHRFVQPRAACDIATIGKSSLNRESMRMAADFVMRNPAWRLSIQTHKLVGVP